MEKFQADLVVIGCGAAGLSAVLAAQRQLKSIFVLSKGNFPFSGSTFNNLNSRWGLTFAQNDHGRELLALAIDNAAKGTNLPQLSRLLVEQSHRAFLFLEKCGVDFLRTKSGALQRFPPCFCSTPLAAVIADTGQCARKLTGQIDKSTVTILSGTEVREIIRQDNCIQGVIANQAGQEYHIQCKAVVLATGGNGAIFPRHIVDPQLTGDGYRLAGEIGLKLQNMGYQQRIWEDIEGARPRFAPPLLFEADYQIKTKTGAAVTIPSELAKYQKARLKHVPISNLQEDRCLDDYLLRHLDEDNEYLLVCSLKNYDLKYKIAPHVQASNGGIVISSDGATEIAGLFAAGEVTTGMHGGDRVGGMMITNCLVFGRRAGEAASRFCR